MNLRGIDLAAADLAIAIWALLWTGGAGVIAFRPRNGDRLRAAGWLVPLAALLASLEDPRLLIYMASTASPRSHRDRPRAVVHAHVIGHI